MKEYKIITAETSFDLETYVNNFLRLGCELEGGLSVIITDKFLTFFHQAISREIE